MLAIRAIRSVCFDIGVRFARGVVGFILFIVLLRESFPDKYLITNRKEMFAKAESLKGI